MKYKFVFAGVMVGQYLQNVTKKLDLGAELLYQYGSQVPGNQIAIYTLAGRYRGIFNSSAIPNLSLRICAL